MVLLLGFWCLKSWCSRSRIGFRVMCWVVPHAGIETGEGGMLGVPLGNQLLEVTWVATVCSVRVLHARGWYASVPRTYRSPPPTAPQRQAALCLQFACRPACTCIMTQKAATACISAQGITGAHHPYLHRGVRMHQIEKDGVTHPSTRGQLSRVSGRVELGSG